MKKIGKYDLEHIIGKGAVGEIWKARDTVQGMNVALKILKDLEGIIGAKNISGPEILLAEARTQTRIGVKAHAVRIYNADTVNGDENSIYISKEFIDGPNLREYVQHKSLLPIEEIIRVSLEVSKGLDEIHSEGILHNDIKPENILVEKGGRVVVDDFGSSPTETERKAYGWILASAPETFENVYSEQSDLYSLGVLMYWLVEGEYPFTSSIEDWSGLDLDAVIRMRGELKKNIQTMPPRLIKRDVPLKLTEIIYKLLEKEPGDRYCSAAELCSDLDSLRKNSRVVLVEKYSGMDLDYYENLDSLIEEFLTSLDKRMVFDKEDITEGRFPYGVKKKESGWTYTFGHHFCSGCAPSMLLMMHILSGEDKYKETALLKTKDIFAEKEAILRHPSRTGSIYGNSAAFFNMLDGSMKKEIEEAKKAIYNKFDEEAGMIDGTIRSPSHTLWTTHLYNIGVFLMNYIGSKEEKKMVVKSIDAILRGNEENICESFILEDEEKVRHKNTEYLSRTLGRTCYSILCAAKSMIRIDKKKATEYFRISKRMYDTLAEMLEKHDYEMPYDLNNPDELKPDNYGRAWCLLAAAKAVADGFISEKMTKAYYKLAASMLTPKNISSGKGILARAVRDAHTNIYESLIDADHTFVKALMLPVLKRKKQLEKYRWIYSL